MRAWNRAKLLWGYLTRQDRLAGLPVEYIVETTAKCNLYCPMCPRETHPQPKEDMADEVFERLVTESGLSAEHMMLIGLGEPLLDPKIFDRVEFCDRHGIYTLLSTNGMLLDEETSARLLETPLEHITFSFDGATKETFEYYRKGARFERVRDNFVRFARMKHERGAKVQIVVQMIQMNGTVPEAEEFLRFWKSVPGVDQVRLKQDETVVLQPGVAHPAGDWAYPCHYLWRGPMYVKQSGAVYPCCHSYELDGQPIGRVGEQSLQEIWNAGPIRDMRRLHAVGRGHEVDVCSRCPAAIPHPALVVGSLIFHGRWVRKFVPVIERLGHLSKLPVRLFTPPNKVPSSEPPLVQVGAPPRHDGH